MKGTKIKDLKTTIKLFKKDKKSSSQLFKMNSDLRLNLRGKVLLDKV